MRIGLIGTGNMGSILAEALIESGATSASSITAVNRTKAKAYALQEKFNGMVIVDTAAEAAASSDLIFVCVKPLEVLKVLQEIKPYLNPKKCLISITSPINTAQLEKIAHCSVARVIPSITNRAFSGVSLISYGKNCKSHWKVKIGELFAKISLPKEIEQNITRVSSDIVSCGPAFFSYLLRRFIDAAVKETQISEQEATSFTEEMIIGLGELLKKGHYTLPTLQEKVCVKGGITGEGIKVLEAELGELFEHMFQATHGKFDEELKKVEVQYSSI